MPERPGSVLQASMVRLVRRGAWAHAGRLLEKSHPADIAEVLDRLTPADRKAVFDLIRSDEVRAEVLSMLEFTAWADFVRDRAPEVVGRIVRHMSPDDAAMLLRELPRDQADEILSSMGEAAEGVESLLGYTEETAGAIMSPEFFALSEQLSVKTAVERLQQAGEREASFYVYVVDEGDHLVGTLSLRQLIMQPPDKTLRDFMTPDPIRVTTDADQEEVSRIVARYDLLAVPVVDTANRPVGVVTVDDIIDVMREEATEDILKMVGTTVEETTSPGPLRGAWIRFPWLAVAFMGSVGGIYLLSEFEGVMQKTLQISFFLPTVLAMGGNVASQCAMVVVRGLATGRLALSEVGRIVSHELSIAALLAVVFAAALFAAGSLMDFGGPRLPQVVALGLFSSMMIAAALGTLLPLMFSRLGIDPAVASGPFITTSIDVLGILSFFSIAYFML
jgi:magnesium transporter